MENARILRWKPPELIWKGPGYRYRQPKNESRKPKNACRGSILLAPPARGSLVHSVERSSARRVSSHLAAFLFAERIRVMWLSAVTRAHPQEQLGALGGAEQREARLVALGEVLEDAQASGADVPPPQIAHQHVAQAARHLHRG
eukprot:833516-Prorocentrum_minimum.AAC.1